MMKQIAIIAAFTTVAFLMLLLTVAILTRNDASPDERSPQDSTLSPLPSEPLDRALVSSLEPTEAETTTPSSTVARSGSNPLPRQVSFQNPVVAGWVKDHPNGPYRFIPDDASADSLTAFETEAQVILGDWERERDRLLTLHGGDPLSFSSDPAVSQNDRDRQARLKNLVISLWPDCWPKGK